MLLRLLAAFFLQKKLAEVTKCEKRYVDIIIKDEINCMLYSHVPVYILTHAPHYI